MKKFFIVALSVMLGASLFAQDKDTADMPIYKYEIYGQDFEIYEITDGTKFSMEITMSDNKTKLTKNYDMEYPMVFCIFHIGILINLNIMQI